MFWSRAFLCGGCIEVRVCFWFLIFFWQSVSWVFFVVFLLVYYGVGGSFWGCQSFLRVYIYVYMYVYTQIQIYLEIQVRIFVYTSLVIKMYICVYICIRICVFRNIGMYICVYTCIGIFFFREVYGDIVVYLQDFDIVVDKYLVYR